MYKPFSNLSIVLTLLLLVGCNTLAAKKIWPTNLPERNIFVDAFLDNRQINFAEPEVIEAHLIWIVRFYQGTILYPNGWNRVSERFIASIDKQKVKKRMAKRVQALGILIANEWSQDNGIRRINSTHVATWGSALRTSAERADQSEYITKVEYDVKALIDGSLEPKKIDYERYYPSEDYDNF
ncbi:MAG: hypothetical protein JKX81_06925 [Arenicella sp.]|nr:hypothetical protein [Arenicella sp.]